MGNCTIKVESKVTAEGRKELNKTELNRISNLAYRLNKEGYSPLTIMHKIESQGHKVQLISYKEKVILNVYD